MTVITTSFSNTANQNWITSTGWVATDPSFIVNTQLTNFVNEINDPTIIEIVKTPNDATTKTTTNYVQWLLRCRDGDTSSDFGLLFGRRYSGPTNTSTSDHVYYARTDSTANNGYGTYTTLSSPHPNVSFENFANAGNFFIAYEGSGTTPWFVYSWENATKDTRMYRFLLRLDTSSLSAGSYYPASGLGKWISCIGYTSGGVLGNTYIVTPQNGISAPFKGVQHAALLRAPTPSSSSGAGNNVFYRLSGQYGSNHYLGQPTNDILVSNLQTGVWGDTITLAGSTYRCLQGIWVKIA